MRVWLVSPCPFDAAYGGLQKSAQVAWEGLTGSSQIDDAQLVCYGADCAMPGDQSRLCSKSKLGAAWNAVFLPKRPVDLILFWHVNMLKLLPLLRPGRARIVLFVHGVECWRPFDRATRRRLAAVDLFLSGSYFSLNRFLAANPACERTQRQVVSLGVDAAETAPRPPDGAPAALILGRMARSEDYKGHRQLIAAWPQVLEQVPAAELWIAGAGDLEPELIALASTRNGKSIRFHGLVSDEKKLDLLRRCRCLAMPSASEGFGLVYLEAMRLGRPCLVNTVGAGLEVVNPPEAGLAADPDTPHELAGALSRLLQPGEQWDEWSWRARLRYNHRFTARDFQQRLLDVLCPAAAVDS